MSPAAKLRKGWTTGSCATAATKAACLLLRDGDAPGEVAIPLPRSDQRPSFTPLRCTRDGEDAVAVVVKDAGDDPDVTHGAHLTARVTLLDAEPGLVLDGGDGVGRVTKEGLGLEVGGPAINRGPRAQIAAAVAEVFDLDAVGVRVEISVPRGEEMAAKTSNGRLGILGGISILGDERDRAAVLDGGVARVRRAGDRRHGRARSTDARPLHGRAQRGRGPQAAAPTCPRSASSRSATSSATRSSGHGRSASSAASSSGWSGSSRSSAAGVMMTHTARSKVDPALLAELVAGAGGSAELVASVGAANTARHAWEQWTAAGVPASDALCTRAHEQLEAYVKQAFGVDVVMLDPDGTTLVGASPGARERVDAGALAGGAAGL